MVLFPSLFLQIILSHGQNSVVRMEKEYKDKNKLNSDLLIS